MVATRRIPAARPGCGKKKGFLTRPGNSGTVRARKWRCGRDETGTGAGRRRVHRVVRGPRAAAQRLRSYGRRQLLEVRLPEARLLRAPAVPSVQQGRQTDVPGRVQ